MRRNTAFTQVMIVVLAVAAALFGGMSPVSAGVFVLTLEIGALAGTWWGRRLRKQAESAPY